MSTPPTLVDIGHLAMAARQAEHDLAELRRNFPRCTRNDCLDVYADEDGWGVVVHNAGQCPGCAARLGKVHKAAKRAHHRARERLSTACDLRLGRKVKRARPSKEA